MDYNDQLRFTALLQVPPSQWLERDIDFLETCYADNPEKLAEVQALKLANFGAPPYVKAKPTTPVKK